MSKTFISRMSLVIINKCNQKCSWCFEGAWKDKPLQMMSINDIEKLLKWKKWDSGRIPAIFLMGGEPTLHPELLNIMDLIHAYNPRISKCLLTNLTCSTDLLHELVERNVMLFINIDQFESTNNVKNQNRILENLDYLNSRATKNTFSYNLSVTVSEPDKDFTFLYDIIKKGKDRIFNIRIASSCIGYGMKNQFQKYSSDAYYNKVLEVINKCNEISSNLHYSSECAIDYCFLSDDLVKELTRKGYNLKFKCGEPEPNADILPDMSAHWCFALDDIPEMKIDNVFNYPDYDSMINELRVLYSKFNSKYKHICSYYKCIEHNNEGACAALNYYLSKNNV